ncbi:DUF1684 domain-containing protein [Brachybacterium sp. DNPG3]
MAATDSGISPDTDPQHAWEEFRARRDESLRQPHGILSQVALHWVEPDAGEQSFEGVPGRWSRTGTTLTVSWSGEELELLEPGAEDEPDDAGQHRAGRHRARREIAGDVRLARFGDDVQIDVIPRGDRIGLRVLDPSAPRRLAFDGVPVFPFDAEQVLVGRFVAAEAGADGQRPEVVVGSALPWLEQRLPVAGTATFDIAGEETELLVTGESSILFHDDTSGTETPGWRVVGAQIDGEAIRVDLNRAVDFPCAFSLWATCPKPPAGNRLPFAVRSGERSVGATER